MTECDIDGCTMDAGYTATHPDDPNKKRPLCRAHAAAAFEIGWGIRGGVA